MNQDSNTQQSIFDHLTELRVRLVKSAYAVLIGFGLAYSQSEKVFDIIRTPIAPFLQGGGLVFTGPVDKFMSHIKVSFLVGIILVCPFWIYQVWQFVAPGLHEKEKKYAGGFISTAIGLFLSGVSFTYFVVLPMAFKFLMTFGGETDKPMITIDDYLSFFITTTLAFGLAFEMPLIITILGSIGVVSSQFLREKRRYAIVILSVLCAVITPPDLLSMVLMLVPMCLLYEVSILAVMFFERKKIKEQSALR